MQHLSNIMVSVKCRPSDHLQRSLPCGNETPGSTDKKRFKCRSTSFHELSTSMILAPLYTSSVMNLKYPIKPQPLQSPDRRVKGKIWTSESWTPTEAKRRNGRFMVCLLLMRIAYVPTQNFLAEEWTFVYLLWFLQMSLYPWRLGVQQCLQPSGAG